MKNTARLNLALYATSVLIYSVLWAAIMHPSSFLEIGLHIILIALLCAPFNIGGNIWTMLGNAANDEGSIYSLLSFYQDASSNAVSVFGFLSFQHAGHEAGVLFGVPAYQYGKEEAILVVGISFCQTSAERCRAFLALYQRVGEDALMRKERVFAAFAPLRAR